MKKFLLILAVSFFLGCSDKNSDVADPEIITERVTITSGDVLLNTFTRTKILKEDTHNILRELKKHFNISKIHEGEFYEVYYTDGQYSDWVKFCYYPRGMDFYTIVKSSGIITSEKKRLGVNTSRLSAKGVIESSLWNAMSAGGVQPDIILSFADIFAWQVDFLTDTRAGDEFSVIYEQSKVSKKGTVTSSQIIGARYIEQKKVNTAIYFENAKGQGGYFNEEGKSVRRAFLKAPLQFRRISSYFTTARKHPVLKYVRPHLGIDYAAPQGTPVSAIGDGTVTRSEYAGQNGNLVIIRHSNGYQSSYGHLKGFARGIRRGVRVSQGQVIGYVGSTGLSTGPHLDFRMKHNGRFINFLTMKQPSLQSLSGTDLKDFLEYKQAIVEQLDSL
jgi:murein DD-endopeptidase MepM/ murein hydrolase activator NlpD